MGVRRYGTSALPPKKNQVGQVVWLGMDRSRWSLLTIDISGFPWRAVRYVRVLWVMGMKESIEAARTVVRSRSARLGIKSDVLKRPTHIHVPEGATPKDGPSAGIAMTTALVSIFTGFRCVPMSP